MKINKFLISLGAVSMICFSACSGAQTPAHSIKIEPAKFSVYAVDNESAGYSQNLPAGRYEFEVDDQDTANPARFCLYLSDEEYDSMSGALEQDLINSLGPDQSLELTLHSKEFLYVAAVSNKTGHYEDDLGGVLEVEAD